MKSNNYLILLLLLSGIFISNSMVAQTLYSNTGGTTYTKKVKFYLAGGTTFSVLDIEREGSDKPRNCFNVRACLLLNNKFRVLAETAWHRYDLSPTWTNIQWNNFEIDFHYIGHFEESSTGIYLLTGIGVQNWSGLFTGVNDYNRVGETVEPNTRHGYTWGTLNAGCGVEKDFDKIGIFGEFKLRGRKKNFFTPVNIIDVVYTVGVRYNFNLKYDRTKASEDGSNRKHFRHDRHQVKTKNNTLKLPNDRYHWFPKK